MILGCKGLTGPNHNCQPYLLCDVYNPVLCPVPSHPGVGHLEKYLIKKFILKKRVKNNKTKIPQ